MNLHITPSFKIDRLCKTASVLLFLVQFEHCFKNDFRKRLLTERIISAHVTDVTTVHTETVLRLFARYYGKILARTRYNH